MNVSPIRAESTSHITPVYVTVSDITAVPLVATGTVESFRVAGKLVDARTGASSFNAQLRHGSTPHAALRGSLVGAGTMWGDTHVWPSQRERDLAVTLSRIAAPLLAGAGQVVASHAPRQVAVEIFGRAGVDDTTGRTVTFVGPLSELPQGVRDVVAAHAAIWSAPYADGGN